MNDIDHIGSRVKGARAEIKARRNARGILIRGVFHDRRTPSPINVDELTAAIAQALREALK